MKSSVGFLKAFWGCCSGTAIFERLKDNSWWRIIWHTILLSLLAGGIVTLLEMRRFTPVLQRTEQAFCAAFGDRICVSEDYVTPAASPEKNRMLTLPMDTLLFYVGTGESGAKLPEKELPLVRSIIIWSASDFASAMQLASGEWLWGKCSLHDGETRSSGDMEQINTEELVRKVRDFHQKKWFLSSTVQENSNITVPVRTLTKIITWMTGATVFLLLFAEFLLSQWILTALYAGVFALINAKRLKRLTLRQYWKVGLYAGFPALAVGACWPALELPFLDFRLVYMIGLVFYWMVVIGRLERSAATPDNNQGGTPDER